MIDSFERPESPKLRANSTDYGRSRWYPYYAGYSPQFVRSILENLELKGSKPILDPWNGSGTTTTVCSIHGYPSLGYDINPVMVIVAKARLLQDAVRQSLKPLLEALIDRIKRVPLSSTDPLLVFFSEKTTSFLRGFQDGIGCLLIDPDVSKKHTTDEISSLAALFLVLLFRVLRKQLAQLQGSNPTWLRFDAAVVVDFGSDDFIKNLRSELDILIAAGLVKEGREYGAGAEIQMGDSRKLPLNDESVAGVITSPPYCTRIDYAVATRLELAVLGHGATDFRGLREKLIGTPVVKPQTKIGLVTNPIVRRTLDQIKNHPSKASESYYSKTYEDYFAGMDQSIREIARVIEPKGAAALVVQGSYYKNIYVDLPTLITSMAADHGLVKAKRWNFTAHHSMRRVNKKATERARRAAPIEAVLLLEKA